MYGEDLRWRVVSLSYYQGFSRRGISNLLQISRSTVKRILKKFRTQGVVVCEKVGHPFRSRLDDQEILVIMEAIIENPGLMIKEIVWQLQQTTGLTYSISTISRALKRFGVTRKRARIVALQRRDDLRIEYRAMISLFPDDQLVFVDETGFDKRLTRKYAYSFSGTRAIIRRYQGWEPRVSSIAAVSTQGLLCVSSSRGTTNGDKFLEFVRNELVPTLQPFDGINPNSVVIMDNAAIHHVQGVRDLIEGNGSLLIYLPPYSPDYNPIEEVFSKVKEFIRQNDVAFHACRHLDDVMNFLFVAFMQVSQSDVMGYYRHAQYS